MHWKMTRWQDKDILECEAGAGLLGSEHDALDVVAACGENGCDRLLVPENILSDKFFDLSSGLAGLVFLKLDMYRVRWAAVVSPARSKAGKFGELVMETNRMSSTFRVFNTRETALDWLASFSSVDDANGLNGHGNHGGDAWGSFVFDGVTYPGQGDFGNCTTTEPDPDPVDVCPNIDGLQETIPDGYELDGQLQCVPTEGEPEDPGDPPVVISTVPFLIPVMGVESIDSGQLLLSLSGLGAGLTLLFKGLFGKDK